jgi:sRNA-binding carbon storage regulator CsrA
MAKQKLKHPDHKRLVITRRHGEAFFLDGSRVQVEIRPGRGRQIRVIIEAAPTVLIQREEAIGSSERVAPSISTGVIK